MFGFERNKTLKREVKILKDNLERQKEVEMDLRHDILTLKKSVDKFKPLTNEVRKYDEKDIIEFRRFLIKKIKSSRSEKVVGVGESLLSLVEVIKSINQSN